MADMLKGSGLAFLGDTGTYALGAILALLELVAGILVLVGKQLFLCVCVLGVRYANGIGSGTYTIGQLAEHYAPYCVVGNLGGTCY